MHSSGCNELSRHCQYKDIPKYNELYNLQNFVAVTVIPCT